MNTLARPALRFFVGIALAWGSLAQAGTAPVWKVTSPNETTHYLGGSVHALRGIDYPLPPAFNRAFDASSRLIFEGEPGDVSRASAGFLKAGEYPKGDSLKNHVDPRTYAYVARVFRLLNVPEAKFSRYRPWLLAAMLQSLSGRGLSKELGVEGFLTKRARANSKPVYGLESLREGMETFSGLSERQGEAFLLLTFIPPTDASAANGLLPAWRRGDTEFLWRSTRDGFRDYPELGERVLEARNRKWMPKIERYFQSSTPHFVVVGAAHLGGPEGLLALLKQHGYHFEQL